MMKRKVSQQKTAAEQLHSIQSRLEKLQRDLNAFASYDHDLNADDRHEMRIIAQSLGHWGWQLFNMERRWTEAGQPALMEGEEAQ